MKREKIGNIVISVLIAVLMWLFLCADMNAVYPNIYRQPDAGTVVTLVTFLQRIGAAFGDFAILKEAVFAALIVIVIKSFDRMFKCPVLFKILAGVLSALYLFAESFRELNSADFIIGDAFVFVFSLLRGIGLYTILCGVFTFLVGFLDSNKKKDGDRFKWSFKKIFLIIFLLWLPILISIYPGGYLLDTRLQLMQFFGYAPLSDAHPPFNTFVVGICVSLGNKIGHPTVGLFLAVLIQFFFLLFGVSYACDRIVKRVGSEAFGWVCVLFAGCNTMFSFYASCIGKDASYSVSLLVMAVLYLELVFDKEASFKKFIVSGLLFSLMGMLASLMRHTGVYILIVAALLAIAVLIKRIGNTGKKIAFIAVMFSGVVGFYGITKIVYPMMGVIPDKSFLIYVNMLQHTARFYEQYPGELSPEDISVISAVTDFDKFLEHYDPVTSDGIKAITDLNASPEKIDALKKVWIKEIKAHPMIVPASVFNMSYGFWAPVAENTVNDFGNWYYESEYPEFDFKAPSIFSAFRNLTESLVSLWTRLPGIRMLHNPGIYTWMLAFACCYMLQKKKFEYLPAMVPGVLTVAIFLAVPSYYGHPRYCFPVVYSMIVCWGLCLIAGRSGDTPPKPAE